jgi:LCP family protein required for cell wall assembly
VNLSALVVVGLIAGSCSSGASEATDPPPTITTTPTTLPPSTTAASGSASTTTAEPLASVEVDGDLPAGLGASIASLLLWQADDRNDPPDIPEGLAVHLASQPLATPETVSAEATTAEIDGGEIAVIEIDSGDLLLAADEGAGWRIVGAHPVDGTPWYGEEPRMVMVLGSDARPGQDQQRLRADSIHILTANPSEGTGTILGFPRDSWVSSPYGSMKFTTLMAGRGPQVMVDKVIDTWNLPVEGYVVTGFAGFEDLMRQIGSIPITLPIAIPNQKDWVGWNAGEQILSPQRTLEYSRTRKRVPGGDLTRSANQGLVMLATLRVLQMNDITDAPEIVSVLLDHAWSSLAPSDLIQLAATIHTLDADEIENVVLPGTLGRAGAASVVRLTSGAEDMLADLADDGILNDAGN